MEANFPPAAKLNKRLIGLLVGGAIILVAVLLVVIQLVKPQQTPAPATAQVGNEPAIRITPEGFNPATLKVTAGTTVRWINNSNDPVQVASNPYPDRSDLPDLFSAEPLAPGDSYEYTFRKAGTWGYHNVGKPTLGGTVTVE